MTDPMRIAGQLPGVQPITPSSTTPRRMVEGADGETPSFADLLKNSIKEVNSLQKDADLAIQDLTTGKTENVTQVMTAVEKADLAFRALMQVRNKLVDAYDELNRLRV